MEIYLQMDLLIRRNKCCCTWLLLRAQQESSRSGVLVQEGRDVCFVSQSSQCPPVEMPPSESQGALWPCCLI